MSILFAEVVRRCPNCGSESIRRSKRAGFVEKVFFRALFVWPFRCRVCGSRFWDFHRRAPAASASASRIIGEQ